VACKSVYGLFSRFIGWFRNHLKQAVTSDVNPETKGHAKLLMVTIYVVLWMGAVQVERSVGVAWRIQSSDLGYRPKAGSESPSRWGSTSCADVVFRASGPAFVHAGIRRFDGKVVFAAVFASLFA
jgi:hypothetical protein